MDKLEKQLQDQLEGDAKSDIENKASGDYVVLPNFTSVEFEKKSFSNKVDTEADNVSLTGTINFEGVSYKKSDLVDFAKDKLSESIGSDMMIDEDKVETTATDISTKNGKTTAKVNIKAAIIPKIDTEDIAKEISGKSISTATNMLQNISEVERVNIDVFINLPLLPKRLPFSSGKIKIVVDKNG